MAEIINLRMARKALKRDAARRTAAENRARFGQTRIERTQSRVEAERLERTVDGARRSTPQGPASDRPPHEDDA